MIFAYKDVTTIIVILFIIGIIISFFLPFSIFTKLIILILLLIILVFLSLAIYGIRIRIMLKRFDQNDIAGGFGYLNKLLKKKSSEVCKRCLMAHQLEKNIVLNNLAEADRIISYFDDLDKNSHIELNEFLIQNKFILAIKKGNIELAKRILEGFKQDIRNNSNDFSMSKNKQIEIYEFMKYMLIVEDIPLKDELILVEQYYLNKAGGNEFTFRKVLYWEVLMKIYNKLGDDKKINVYETLIKNNVGEFYTFLN